MRTLSGHIPLISVITVVYNGEKTLEQSILSVINQTFNDFEYIVIDGGSTDSTGEILRKYENCIDRIISEPDKGIYDAMNKGLNNASGQYIAFLNADDWYELQMLENVKAKLDSLSELSELSEGMGNQTSCEQKNVIYCNYYTLDEELSPGHKESNSSELHYWKGMTVSHQAMFVHHSVYETLGHFSLEYRYASDYDYFLRMIHAGIPFEKIDYYGVNFRKGGVSTQYMNRSITEVSRIIRKYFGLLSKTYVLFLLTNRLPSMIGNIRILLSKIFGAERINRLRRIKRGIR